MACILLQGMKRGQLLVSLHHLRLCLRLCNLLERAVLGCVWGNWGFLLIPQLAPGDGQFCTSVG